MIRELSSLDETKSNKFNQFISCTVKNLTAVHNNNCETVESTYALMLEICYRNEKATFLIGVKEGQVIKTVNN